MDTLNNDSKWYCQTTEQILHSLNTNINGLDGKESLERLKSYGKNQLPETKKQSAFMRFLHQFHNILIYVLLGSSIITMLFNHWIDTSVILAVVLANAIIGFIQEGKAEKAMSAIRRILAPKATVLRDGQRYTIKAEDLMPGDIVLLEAGDKVSADLRLITAHGLSAQEAILTGESVPVEKNTISLPSEAPLGDRTCMAFSGTLITSGQGKGVVVATGIHTEIGHISKVLSSVKTPTPPLLKQMNKFAQWLTIFILVIAALLLLYGYFVGHYDFTNIFMAVVGLSVAAIPEGLPAVLTITLAVGAQEMARRNAIIRRLPAIETLGSVSVICTDKTGTLTRNEMMVASIITNKHVFTLEGLGYEPKGSLQLENAIASPKEHAILETLAKGALLCNDASLHQHNEIWSVEGDPMEGALLTFSQKVGLDIKKEQSTWTRTDTIPFDTTHRFMATLNHDHENHAFVFVKGAPEKILSLCQDQLINGNTEKLNATYWYEQINRIASLGQRVLAFAIRPIHPNKTVLEHADLEGKLSLIGMVGMIDPPRTEAIVAIAECHRAGIRVKMITGDHNKTAHAIAKQIGLQNSDTVLTGADLDDMDDATLKNAVVDCDIFARTNPEHKLRLVTALQSHDMTVAMTGDGVNDAPALKRANAGIAMGKKGSEATKESADLVLADDNFVSITAAVREGRTVYDNIKKVISWTLPTNAGEAMTVVLALLLGKTLPITPVQILWVNLITAITLGIALAFEPTEENTMKRPPRLRNEPILNASLVWHIILVATLFLFGVYGIYSYAIDQGYSIELARTMSLNTLVVMEIYHLFFVRNIYGTSLTWKAIRGTKIIWAVVIIITLAQLAITYLPVMQRIFATQPIKFSDGLIITGVGIMLFCILEIEKQVRLRILKIKKQLQVGV